MSIFSQSHLPAICLGGTELGGAGTGRNVARFWFWKKKLINYNSWFFFIFEKNTESFKSVNLW